MKTAIMAAAAAAVLGTAAAPAPAAAATKACKPVYNVFDGTRYEGSDLYRIRAKGVSCRSARKLAWKATHKAQSFTPIHPILHFRVGSWHVSDDLRRAVDRLFARAGARTVSWRWGEL